MNRKEVMDRFLILMLLDEVAALRSVLSEFDEDKTCFTQFVRAELIRSIREQLETL